MTDPDDYKYTLKELNSDYPADLLVWCLQSEANARLIAFAPELLQAIKDLFRECAMVHKSWGDGDNTKEADAAIKRAKDAIAKATAE